MVIPKDGLSNIDYSLLLKETLLRLKEGLESGQMSQEHLLNLVDTATDYAYYLEDRRTL